MILQASVIIPTFEDWDRLQKCLDCLANQSVAPDLFEVIVANNNASGTLPALPDLPVNARVIHATKPGSYAARNAALRDARGEVLFFTDSDCLPDRRWIEAGLARIATLGPTGRVTGKVELFPKGPGWTGAELFDRVFSFDQKHFLRNGWAVTANLVVRRAAFDLVGPFDEDRFSGGDRTWNMRATQLGCDLVFSEDALVLHPARASFAELAMKVRRLYGGEYRDQEQGLKPKRPLVSYLGFLTINDFRKVGLASGLSTMERIKLLWICFRLGLVRFFEAARLRCFSGEPRRS
ncbi:MAG TPA: glycosyltransferase [Tabrizicola sp.]|nr:glycosyltransferase [Tabrizicola sp.]